MIVLTHILIAFASLIATTLLSVFPSKLKQYVSYTLIGLTLLSGTTLVIITHQQLFSSCITGLAYLAVATAGVLVGQHRLAKAQIKIRNK